jgi:hypothetical protein
MKPESRQKNLLFVPSLTTKTVTAISNIIDQMEFDPRRGEGVAYRKQYLERSQKV